MINAAVAVSEPLFRKGIISYLSSNENLNVYLEAESDEELIQKLKLDYAHIDVLLLYNEVSGLRESEAVRILNKVYPHIPYIIISDAGVSKIARELILKGARGFLDKNATPEELICAVNAVCGNMYYFSSRTMTKTEAALLWNEGRRSTTDEVDITRREKQILKLICEEYTSQEISEKLFISESTVNGHRNNLLLKTGCRNTAGLVLFAIKNNVYSFS